MNIRQFSKLENGVYVITIVTEDWSERDRQLMTKYGEPSIDLGGSFYDDTPYVDFSLPENLVLIFSESPFTQRFDLRDYPDAENMAITWKNEIVLRLSEAIATLRANDDTFTREEVLTV